MQKTSGRAREAITFSAALDRQGLRPFQIALVAVVLLVLIIDGVDIQLLALVSPIILVDWGIDRAAFGPAMSGALIGMALGALAGGWLGDRYGRRNILVTAITVFGLATVAAGFTGNVASMTALRLVSGFGFGAAGPCALALATEWLPRRLRTHVVALLSIGTPAGGTLGAWLVLVILPRFGWPGAFFLCGAFTLAVTILCGLILRETPAYLLSKGRQAQAEAEAKFLVPGDYRLVAETPAVQERRPGGARLFDHAHRRLVWGSSLSFFFAAAVAYAFQSWTPVLLTGGGFSMSQALTASFFFNLASMLGALSGGVANRAFGSRRVLVFAATAALGCIVGLALVLAGRTGAPDAATEILAILLVSGAGAFISLGIATIYTMMTLGYAPSCRASGIGFGMMMSRLGGIATSLSGGWLLDLGGDSFWPFFAALIACAGLVGMGAFVSNRHVPSAREERAGA